MVLTTAPSNHRMIIIDHARAIQLAARRPNPGCEGLTIGPQNNKKLLEI